MKTGAAVVGRGNGRPYLLFGRYPCGSARRDLLGGFEPVLTEVERIEPTTSASTASGCTRARPREAWMERREAGVRPAAAKRGVTIAYVADETSTEGGIDV
jgi:hypothetical protein